jgi:hypothetical protein
VNGFLGSEADFSRFYGEHVDGLSIFFTRRCLDPHVALERRAATWNHRAGGPHAGLACAQNAQRG